MSSCSTEREEERGKRGGPENRIKSPEKQGRLSRLKKNASRSYTKSKAAHERRSQKFSSSRV